MIATLKTKKDFHNILQHGTKYVSRYFVLLMSDNTKDMVLFGMIVTRKVGNAVKRNQIKRRLRVIIKKICCELNLQKITFCIIARYKMLQCDFNQLYHSLKHAIKKTI